MVRAILIIVATILGAGTSWLAWDTPIRADMKRATQQVVGLSFFFMTFFAIVRFIDDYFWWSIPAATFIVAIYYAVKALDRIKLTIKAITPDPWLAKVDAAAVAATNPSPMTGSSMTAAELETQLAAFDQYQEEHPDPKERRFLDDFFIADEADLGPTELELDRLDEFIFTSRHGYLIHDPDPESAPCDVVTVIPGMSIADLIEAARQHQCARQLVA